MITLADENFEEREALRHQINRVLDNNFSIENTDIIKELSTFSISDYDRVRRTLKNEVEKKEAEVNLTLIESFRKVKNELDKICDNISTLAVSVNNMSERIKESKTKTQHLIHQTSKLRSEESKAEKKTRFVEAFLNRYQLSPEQLSVLNDSTKNAQLTPEFFILYKHLEVIYEECKMLIKFGFEAPAMEIIDKISLYQEAAIDRLYRWTQNSFRSIDHSSNSLLSKAMQTLQNRQILFNNVLEEYCTLRKSVIVTNFIETLTKGKENSKPIEFYVNDPKRYIGDILVLVSQLIPIENENLSLLLHDCDLIDKEAEVRNALVAITEAICPPLKVRADLIITSDKDPITLCSITTMFRYYKNIVKGNIPEGHLLVTLDELSKKSEDMFLMSLDSKIQKDLSYGVKAPSADLTPSPIVTDLISFLREVLSVVSSGGEPDVTTVKIIASHILDPLLHAINETACHLSSTDMAVYLLNCMYHIQCTLSMYHNMEERTERLQAQSDAQIDTLTSEQVSSLVANLNLGPIYTILQEKTKGPLSVVPGMETASLKAFLYKFDNFVAMPNVYILPQLGLLISHVHKKNVQKRSFDVIVAIYKQLYNAVLDPANGYPEPESILRRTPDDISNLLKS